MKKLSIKRYSSMTWSEFWSAMKWIIPVIIIATGIYFAGFADLIRDVATEIKWISIANMGGSWGNALTMIFSKIPRL